MLVTSTSTSTIPTSIDALKVGLDYLIKHFDASHFPFPRNIMTRKLNRQIEVLHKETALREFQLSNWQDCRINAYPTFTNYNGISFTAPSIVFIDLDLQFFKSQESLNRALRSTLRLMQKTVSSGIKIKPTVLWTGNGYHVYLPIDGLVLEEESVFSEFIDESKSLTTKFMRFSERYFAGYKQDPNHKPSVNNCLLRIPGTYNSKNGQQVRIVQEWNGYRVPIQYLLRQFRRYLIQERIDNSYYNYSGNGDHTISGSVINRESKDIAFDKQLTQKSIYWIEKLLLTPISDERKYCIWRILAPYLVNVKGLNNENAYDIVISWLDECNKLERLSFYHRSRVRDDIRRARRVGYYPISLSNLQQDKPELYEIIQSGGCVR